MMMKMRVIVEGFEREGGSVLLNNDDGEFV